VRNAVEKELNEWEVGEDLNPFALGGRTCKAEQSSQGAIELHMQQLQRRRMKRQRRCQPDHHAPPQYAAQTPVPQHLRLHTLLWF
jgi:hypothetical protein